MKKLFVVLLALMVCFAMPLLAQEDKKEMGGDMEMAPPTPLTKDAFCSWMVGEWKGWSDGGSMGKAESWEKVEMKLNGQFLHRTAKDSHGYEGMGILTMHPETGQFMGGWVDNFRGMYDGNGNREGNVLSMEWKGAPGTYKQVSTKVDNNTYTYTWSFTDPAGNTMQGKGEMTRVKKMSSK